MTQIQHTVMKRLDCAPTDDFIQKVWDGTFKQISRDATSTDEASKAASLASLSTAFGITQHVLMLVQATCIQTVTNVLMSLKPIPYK